MLSVIVWQCECGCIVKAMYETNGATIIRCPKRSCPKTQKVEGRIVQLWAKNTDDYWQLQDVPSLVMPAA
jgi:hypothetical protein